MLVRLTLWSLVLSICLVVLMSQLLLSRTLLDSRDMQSLVADTSIYDTVRRDVLVPHIQATIQGSEYASVIEKETVTTAVDQTFDDKALDALLAPTTHSLVNWLNSNQSDLSLPVDAQVQVHDLTRALSESIAAQIVALPPCTWLNTAEDIAQYICRPPTVDDSAITRTVEQAIRSDSRFDDSNFNIVSLMLPESTRTFIEPIPRYINILYSAAIFAAGVLVLGVLWLLIRYKFTGIITLGVSAALATTAFGLLVYIVQGLPAQVALESSYQTIVQAFTSLITQEAMTIIVISASVSVALIAVGVAGLLYLRSRRSKQADTVHLHEHPPIDE